MAEDCCLVNKSDSFKKPMLFDPLDLSILNNIHGYNNVIYILKTTKNIIFIIRLQNI
jgi:hypothetical protein